MHDARIEFNEIFMARPWSAFCTCGWKACGQTREEMEQSRTIHLAQHQTEQHARCLVP